VPLPDLRAELLRDLLEFVATDQSEDLLAEVLSATREIDDRDSRAEALSALLDRVGDDQRGAIVREALALMQ
jgi:hypothetical protein